MSPRASLNIEPGTWQVGGSTLTAEPVKPHDENVAATDYYEILRIGQHADGDTIERVYRTLADRFHPDNATTGDAETFLRLKEAYDTLSDYDKRAEYNAALRENGTVTRFNLRGGEFYSGVKGGQNRRLALLCLLYRKKTSSHDSPGLNILELQHMAGCSLEEITNALWYLCEKQWATMGDFATYNITADGFDFVEKNLEDRLEFHSIATFRYYDAADSPESNSCLGEEGEIPSAFASALASDGDLSLADYYEVLGVSSGADAEAIGDAYRRLTDTPDSGDVKKSQRIREAYETLADAGKRLHYDDLRSRTQYSDRFRLRGKEYFDGIKGEQLRRLAVLCVLYRQSTNELPGLTVLDLEQLTGCTREELGSALWYLREKKWVVYGQFTTYSITAAGFDVVENRLDEAARSRALLESDKSGDSGATVRRQLKGLLASLTAKTTAQDGESPGVEAQVTLEVNAEHERRRIVRGMRWDPDVSAESNSMDPDVEKTGDGALGAVKRVVFSMGGKGGVGKTSVMTGLAEWFHENQIPVVMLDLDIENKTKGSLTHFFGGAVPKINIYTPAGLDAFIDILNEDAPAILADMGAGAGKVTHEWFEKMYPDASEAGIAFTAIGVVTSDPASVDSVLHWASALQDRVSYVIVENNLTEHTDFSNWLQNERAEEFRQRFNPAIIRLDYRLADLENATRNHGVRLGEVARRTASVPELQKASLVMRAQSARRRMFAEFDKVKALLLP